MEAQVLGQTLQLDSGLLIILVMAGVIVLLVWLSLLTILVWKTYGFSKSLFGDTKKEDLKEILQEHIQRVGVVQVRLNDIEKMLVRQQQKGERHISKVGIVRFNPFKDTGGDQSFALALLDESEDGVVISSMHGRHRTRVYAKPVRHGEATEYEFSDEEKEAIRKAKALGHK